MKRILTEQQVHEAIATLFACVQDSLPADQTVAIVGIRTRGETLARRLVERFRSTYKDRLFHYGVLDVTFYRDDLSRRRGFPLVRATEIDFDLDDCWLVLVDDVIQSGRSIRAALDAIHDFGRPRVIRLAVLIDRGGREVPIAPDFTGVRVDAQPGQRVQLLLQEIDGKEGVFILPRD